MNAHIAEYKRIRRLVRYQKRLRKAMRRDVRILNQIIASKKGSSPQIKRPWVWLFVAVFLLYGLITVLVFIPLVKACYGETE